MTPAPVDHDERRARLTEVLLSVVAESGLEAASIRTIADRAGVSIGTVQHYFKSKDEMLRHAYQVVSDDIGRRADERANAAGSWKGAVREILLELLPLDARRTAALRVSIAFAHRAMFSPELGAKLRADLNELEEIFTTMLREAGVADPEREAMTLLALNSGLAEPLLFGEGDPQRVVEALDAHLDRLFS
ncbi:TetR/AcrR family transcriptional regulator [Solirubrobacter sp. CPCC 204708]|uniref:TetR/AcrR family transcriptional regulator n=1 Tax=Solirubrobacter deserti TaxID=2282478 RepID=A0ABT4RGE7_9ACTN|nr:TetR/AcrR family transcriptional regulator [Solirubrobacter deserti]MBE2319642.1 TetR/AcrR family transcriptional regulator [Solirubrobacter deserti]MDA0137619.1 TetR/AcrR family transcriptional regulator [Solirubrobacter deserti]